MAPGQLEVDAAALGHPGGPAGARDQDGRAREHAVGPVDPDLVVDEPGTRDRNPIRRRFGEARDAFGGGRRDGALDIPDVVTVLDVHGAGAGASDADEHGRPARGQCPLSVPPPSEPAPSDDRLPSNVQPSSGAMEPSRIGVGSGGADREGSRRRREGRGAVGAGLGDATATWLGVTAVPPGSLGCVVPQATTSSATTATTIPAGRILLSGDGLGAHPTSGWWWMLRVGAATPRAAAQRRSSPEAHRSSRRPSRPRSTTSPRRPRGPGRSRRPGRVVGRGHAVDDDLERPVAELRWALAAEPLDDLRQHLGTGGRPAVRPECLDDDPVPAGRPAHRPLVRPRPDDPDGDPRALDGSRQERHRAESVVRSVEGERFAALEAVEDGEGLVEPFGTLSRPGRLADVAEPEIVGRAEADGKDEPPVRQDVERHRLAGQLPGPSPGRRENDRPDRDPLGPHRDRREEDPRVVHHGVPDRDRVVREHAVPAGRLGLSGEIGGQPRIARRKHDSVAHRTMIADAAARCTRLERRSGRSGRT